MSKFLCKGFSKMAGNTAPTVRRGSVRQRHRSVNGKCVHRRKRKNCLHRRVLLFYWGKFIMNAFFVRADWRCRAQKLRWDGFHWLSPVTPLLWLRVRGALFFAPAALVWIGCAPVGSGHRSLVSKPNMQFGE